MSEVIVNELLCFMTNKIDILDHDSLVLLCSRSFSNDEVVTGKTILKTICTNLDVLGNLRIGGRTGTDKLRKNLEDVCATLHKVGNAGPIFAASNLKRLPPVTFDNIDVTHLLFKIEKLETDAASRHEIEKRTISIIEKLEKEIASMKEAEARTTTLLQSMLEASAESNDPKPNFHEKEILPPQAMSQGSEKFFTPMKESSSREQLTPSKRLDGVKMRPQNLPSLKKSGDTVKSTLVPLGIRHKIQELRKSCTPKVNSNNCGLQQPSFGSPTSVEDPLSEKPKSTLQPRYSDVLREDEPGQWKLVAKKGKSSKLTRGTLEDARGVRVAERSIELFTKGWSTDETCEGVMNFLKNNHNIVAKCDPIRTRATVYKCFKISISIYYNINFHDPKLWPVGVAVGKCHNRSYNKDTKTKSNVGHIQRLKGADYFNTCIV